jgi:hypothetical protein
MGPTFGEELAARAEHASGSMMPEQIIYRGCEGVRQAMKASADARTKEIGILAAAACSSAEGEGLGKSEALGEPAVAGDEGMSLSSGVANEIARQGMSMGGGLRSTVRNVTDATEFQGFRAGEYWRSRIENQ